MTPVTICFVYFRTLTLANLDAALYSVRQQDLSSVYEIIITDNNTDDSLEAIHAVVEKHEFPVPVRVQSYKHGDLTKTHAWSTNIAVKQATTPWVFFTRADYLLSYDLLSKCLQQVDSREPSWCGFVTASGCHLTVPIDGCEVGGWRQRGPQCLERVGQIYDYTCIDTGVWLSRLDTFNLVGGVDERFTAWGHAQTHFQWKLHEIGVQCVRIPEVLFFHPDHGGDKDIVLANLQAREQGLNLQELWARYDGPRMY